MTFIRLWATQILQKIKVIALLEEILLVLLVCFTRETSISYNDHKFSVECAKTQRSREL